MPIGQGNAMNGLDVVLGENKGNFDYEIKDACAGVGVI